MTTATEDEARPKLDGRATLAKAAAKLRNRRNAVTISAGIKLLIFTVVSILVTGLLAAIMGNIGFGDQHRVPGGLLQRLDAREGRRRPGRRRQRRRGQEGRALRAHQGAGDVPGEVRRAADDRPRAPRSASSTWSATATSRSRPATRRRALPDGSRKASAAGPDPDHRHPARGGDTIPVSQTTPALDLTALFNGFQPLFQALTPEQVNELSMNLVQVLQGEGGTVQELLANTASLTNTPRRPRPADRRGVDNLTTTLETVDQRHQELNTLVTELQRLDGRPGPRPRARSAARSTTSPT